MYHASSDDDDSFERWIEYKKSPTTTASGHSSSSPAPAVVVEAYTSKLLLSDDEIRALGIRDIDIELYRRMRYQQSFGIGHWYHLLEEHTFKTVFVRLSFEESREICDVHMKKKTMPTPLLKAVEARLDEAIAKVMDTCFFFFCAVLTSRGKDGLRGSVCKVEYAFP